MFNLQSVICIIVVTMLAYGDMKAADSKKNRIRLIQNSAEAVLAKAEIKQNSVSFGRKTIVMDKNGGWKVIANGSSILHGAYYYNIANHGGFGINYQKKVKNMKFKYISDKSLFEYSCEFKVGKQRELGTFKRTVKVLKNGLLRIDISSQIPADVKVNYQLMNMYFPFIACEGKTVLINDKRVHFSEDTDAKTDVPKWLYGGKRLKKIKSFIFSPSDINTTFSMRFLTDNKGSLSEYRLKRGAAQRVAFRIYPDQNGKISYILDIRKNLNVAINKSDLHAGINFWANDHLHVPNFSYNRNLLQNPSFESDLRYYMLQDSWGDHLPQTKKLIYSTTDKESKFGNRSLEIIALENRPGIGMLQTFSMPVIPGKKYTFSFYAKSDQAKVGLELRSITGEWMQFPELSNFQIPTDNWKRFSTTFIAPNRVVTILMRGQYNGSANGGTARIWVDGLQFEQGDTCSEWVDSSPVHARITTSSRDNFLQTSDLVNAKLKITTKANVSGTVECQMTDFFYRIIWTKSFKFNSNTKGMASIDLPINDKIKNGIYVIRCSFKLDDGSSFSDYFRITRMKPARRNCKNQDIISSNFWMRLTRKEDHWRRMRLIGLSSFCYFPVATPSDKESFMTLTNELGFRHFGIRMIQGGKIGDVEFNFPQMTKVTPEIEKKVENACYQKAKKYPWINMWFLESESNGGNGMKFGVLKNGNFQDFAKLILACYRGVKRFDKNKKVLLGGGATDMSPVIGIRWTDRVLDAVNKVEPGKRFDGIAIHPYQTTPEDPDLDDNAQAFFKMIDAHGYADIPVYWMEGIYYTPFNIPEWGLTPHKGCSMDHWRAAAFSYDMGWAERISAAYYARSWLVSLKYYKRVKNFNGWMYTNCIDAYLTPLAMQKIPNTLLNLLGDAVFQKDIRFAPKCRAYVFEDEKRRPVAAIWSHISKVDHGYEQSPIGEITFTGELPEVFDLMENRISLQSDANGRVIIPITPFPIFIRGKAGTLDSLCDSIAKISLQNSQISPLRVFTRPGGLGTVNVTMMNLLSRSIKIDGSLKIQGRTFKQNFTLKPTGKSIKKFPLASPIALDKIEDVSVVMNVKINDGGGKIKSDGSFKCFAIKRINKAITIDGNISDWRGIPAIKISNRCIQKKFNVKDDEKIGYKGDQEATFRVAWDENKLYLLVDVVDDKLVHLPRKNISGRYYNDSVQIYIDTFGDGRMKGIKDFDGNDYEYDLFPNITNNSLTVYRRFAPEQQIAGGLLAPRPRTIAKLAKAAFKRTAKGYIYEVAFPKQILAPMILEAGTSVGFSLFINDVDNKRWKSSLTLTPPGTGGFRNPHLYPVMLLAE